MRSLTSAMHRMGKHTLLRRSGSSSGKHQRGLQFLGLCSEKYRGASVIVNSFVKRNDCLRSPSSIHSSSKSLEVLN